MTRNDSVNLTRIMRRDGILSIVNNEFGFSVYMRGNVVGTGETVGEAHSKALEMRARHLSAAA